MSLDRFPTGSPLSSSFPTPSDSDQWLAQDFADDLFSGTSDLGQALSADDDRFFDLQGSESFPDALSELDNLPDQPNDRQVVMAAATAAGLNRNGIRRTAFSTGDLQALCVAPNRGTPSPPDPQRLNIHRTISASSVSAQPGLATVPEGQAMNASLSTGMPTMHYNAEPLVPTEDLSNMSVEELQAELIRTRQAFHSAGRPMYANRQSGQPFQPQQGSFNSMTRPMYPNNSRGGFSEFSMPGMAGSSSGYGGFYQDASGNMQPLSSQPVPSTSSIDDMNQAQQQTQMLQSYADALLYQTDGATNSEGTTGLPATSSAPGLTDMQPGHTQQQESTAPVHTAPAAAPGPAAPSVCVAQHAEVTDRDKMIRRSQSAVELRSLGLPRQMSDANLKELQQVTVELTTPEGHVYKVGRMSNEERAQKILKYRQKRHERNFTKRIKYMCRKTLADTRPRVRGRFARNNDAGAVMPHETKKALAAKAKAGKAAAAAAAGAQRPHLPGPTSANELHPHTQAGQNQDGLSFGASTLAGGQMVAKGMAQPFQVQSAAAPHAFMPIMQHPANLTQPGMTQMPAMQPLLHNGNVYPASSVQGYHYTASVPMAQQSFQNRQLSNPFGNNQLGQAGGSAASHAGDLVRPDQGRATSAQPM